MNGICRYIQKRFKRLYMFVILSEGILELERLLVDPLHPLCLVFPTKYPALHILGFYYEDAKTGYEDMTICVVPS